MIRTLCSRWTWTLDLFLLDHHYQTGFRTTGALPWCVKISIILSTRACILTRKVSRCCSLQPLSLGVGSGAASKSKLSPKTLVSLRLLAMPRPGNGSSLGRGNQHILSGLRSWCDSVRKVQVSGMGWHHGKSPYLRPRTVAWSQTRIHFRHAVEAVLLSWVELQTNPKSSCIYFNTSVNTAAKIS